MSHKIKTGMQKTKLFKDLAADRKICEQCPLKKDMLEHKLILRMTESDPQNRPSAEEIQKVWLPLLQHEIKKSVAAPQKPLTIPREFSRFVTLVALFQRGGNTRGFKGAGVFH